MHRIWSGFINVVFPERCLGCGTAGDVLCSTCLNTIPKPNANLPFWIISLYAYKHPLIKNTIWKLKYHNVQSLAHIYGELLYEAIIIKFLENHRHTSPPIYLIPIPVAKSRLRERGYNQAELLTQALLRRDTAGLLTDGAHLLGRKEMTTRQSHTKHKRERLQNIRGSFVANHNLDPKAQYIIIDDVVTTGATLEEARAALEERGAIHIHAYTIAH